MKIPVKGKVLQALRQNLNIEIAEAARVAKVDVEVFQSWENNGAEVNLSALKDLAQLFNRNWTAFLLNTPPSPIALPGDFRTPMRADKTLSSQTLKAFEKAHSIADNALDLNGPATRNEFVSSNQLSLTGDPDAQAAKVRAALGVELDHQYEFKSEYSAFKAWKAVLTDLGFYIAELEMSRSEVRAFTLTKHGYYVICLNSYDPVKARIFSLFHELGHVLLNQSGICDLHDYTRSQNDRAEVFCNQFAASLLVPKDAFLHEKVLQTESVANDLADIVHRLGRRYRVSDLVIYRRLATCGFITPDQYRSAHRHIDAELEKKPERKGDDGFSLPWPKVIVKQNSIGLTRQVISAYEEGRISPTEAGRYLGESANYLSGVQKELAG